MNKNPSKNIFETASLFYKKKSSPKEEVSPLAEETEETLRRMRELQKEVESRLEDFYERSGFTPREIDNFFQNPDNFTFENWDYMQSERRKLEEKIWEAMGKEARERAIEKKTREAGSQRKKKSIGARKNWIPLF